MLDDDTLWLGFGPERRTKGSRSDGRETSMSKLGTIVDFLHFLRYRKRYWLVPFFIVLLLFGTLLVVAESSAVGPFIYTLFYDQPVLRLAQER